MHHVAACAVDRDGKTLFQMGAIDAPIFLRSAAKPFIAAAVVAGGAVERFGLDETEIAVMAGSHYGEPFHVDAVRSMLHKIELPERALQCGVHTPYSPAVAADLERRGVAPTALYNNCSGKHAGILALCLLLGSDPGSYMELENPAQQEILRFCARLTGDDARSFPIALDGCGIPVFATPLHRAAMAFMRLATLRGIDDADAAALSVTRNAMVRHPLYVSGTGQFDSVLMQAASQQIAGKGGAEGVHGDALMEPGAGFALKVLDGAKRAVPPATLACLDALGMLPQAARDELQSFMRPQIENRAGRVVGEIRARRAMLRAARTP
ncbi:MAG: asparaginase [Vulcanimicrobiaceae bacterium]